MRSFAAVSLSVILGAFLGACQTPPTRVLQTPERYFGGGAQLMSPIKITPETVVLDTRSPFEFSVAHPPRALNIKWQDFIQPDKDGSLLPPEEISRRLARAGIGPKTPVVVAGDGMDGKGDEGRIAWMIAYVGVEQVQFSDLASLRPRMTNAIEDSQARSIDYWKPEVVNSLQATSDEIKYVINNRGIEKPVAYAIGATPVLYRIIDVRSQKDYLGKAGFGARVKVPDLGAINIPWRDFFDNHYRPDPGMAKRLHDVGILPEYRVIVLSDDGLSSAGVTMALRALGYNQAANYPNGLKELLGTHLGY